MAHDVFISYASEDKITADAVCVTLEGKGIRCWVASRDILPGQDHPTAIVDALADARVFVLVFSARSNTASNVRNEVGQAVGRGLPVMTFRIEDALPDGALSVYLARRAWLDALDPPPERHLEALAQAVGLLLGLDSPLRAMDSVQSAPDSPPDRAQKVTVPAAAIRFLPRVATVGALLLLLLVGARLALGAGPRNDTTGLITPAALLCLVVCGVIILVVVRFLRGRPRAARASHKAVGVGDAEPEPPYRLDENVQFTVYRPKVVRPREWRPLLAFAHLSEKRLDAQPDAQEPIKTVAGEVSRRLAGRATSYLSVQVDSELAIPEAAELMFVPSMRGVEFNPPSRTIFWRQDVHCEEFQLCAAEELDGQTAHGVMSVHLGVICIASIGLSIRVESSCVAEADTEATEEAVAKPYRKVFASYSHRDTQIVEQLAKCVKWCGYEFLMDATHLRSGEVWSEALETMIDEADAFLLFWSWNSMHSPFVRREWEYALSLGRKGFVRPGYWEEPMPEEPPGLPPEDLARLHFGPLPMLALAKAPTSPATPRDARPAMEPRCRDRRPLCSAPASRLNPILMALMLLPVLGALFVLSQGGTSGPTPASKVDDPAGVRRPTLAIVLIDESDSFVASGSWERSLAVIRQAVLYLRPRDKICIIGVDHRSGHTDDVRVPVKDLPSGMLMAVSVKREITDQVKALKPRPDVMGADMLGALDYAAYTVQREGGGARVRVLAFADFQSDSGVTPSGGPAQRRRFPNSAVFKAFFVAKADSESQESWNRRMAAWSALLARMNLEVSSSDFLRPSDSLRPDVLRDFMHAQ